MLMLIDKEGDEVELRRYYQEVRFRFKSVKCSKKRCNGCPHRYVFVYWRDEDGTYHDRIVAAVAEE